MTPIEANAKRLKNIEKGLPARYGFRWEDEEKSNLVLSYNNGLSFNELSIHFERNLGGIVAQLISLA
jgi:hypothetical protein